MDNSLSKVSHLNHLATKSADDKNVNLLRNKHNKECCFASNIIAYNYLLSTSGNISFPG